MRCTLTTLFKIASPQIPLTMLNFFSCLLYTISLTQFIVYLLCLECKPHEDRDLCFGHCRSKHQEQGLALSRCSADTVWMKRGWWCISENGKGRRGVEAFRDWRECYWFNILRKDLWVFLGVVDSWVIQRLGERMTGTELEIWELISIYGRQLNLGLV